MVLHPTTQIVLGLSLLIASSGLSFFYCLLLALSIAFLLWMRRDPLAWKWVSRARYLLFVPPIIYGYVTPGESLSSVLGAWSPTWEGLAIGGIQSLRLLTALVGLRLILGTLTANQLATGLVTLLSPLAQLGFNVERFVRRLTLTLAYIEHWDQARIAQLLRAAVPLSAPMTHINDVRAIHVRPMSNVDWLLAAMAISVVVMLR